MATTRAGAQLTARHRAAQLAIRARSIRDLIDLWPIVDPEDLSGTIETFAAAATLLAVDGQQESAAEAISYFESFRYAEGIRSRFSVPDPDLPRRTDIVGDLRGAALKGILDARRAGQSLIVAGRAGLTRVAGALVKQVLTGGRMTIITGSDADREALGWARVTTGDPCTFCRLLASRGAAYKTERAADFEAHEGCACTPEVVYSGAQLPGSPVRQAEAYLAEYTTAQEWARESGTMSKGTSNNALNNYRRWLANGSPDPGEKVTGVPGE